ncbi:hypothetical protein ACGH7X_11545 [Streptomyces sp. BBFR51]|uniref:hypothetical protein n=1 Tax=Streptomyces sp. BBFR51 TaxID=3372856 RepID=UPI0037DCCE05
MSTHAQIGTGSAPESHIGPTHRPSGGTGSDDGSDKGRGGLRGSLRRHPLT